MIRVLGGHVVERQTLTILADAVEAYLLLLAHAATIGLEIDSGFGDGLRSGTHRPEGNAQVRRALAAVRAALGDLPRPLETADAWEQPTLPLFEPEWAGAQRGPHQREGRR